jgi:hypothetical protein
MKVSGQIHGPAALRRGKKTRYSLVGGWVGSRTGLNAVSKRKIPTTRRELNFDRLDRIAYSLVAIPTELSQPCSCSSQFVHDIQL